MDHAVGLGGTGPQARRVLERSAVHLGAGFGQRPRAYVGAGQAEDPVTGLEQFRHDARADEAGGAGEKDTHDEASAIADDPSIGSFSIR